MTNNILQICPSCAESNGATWKNPRNTAPLFLAVCGCCKEVKPCTHIQFWQGIKKDSELVAPAKNAAPATRKKPVAKAAAKPTPSILEGGE